jgi:tol-pal system protein YbgF
LAPASRLPVLGLLLVPLLTGAACVSNDDIQGLHQQMSEIQKQIQTVERKSSSKEEVEKLNQNVATQTTQLLKSNADTAVRLGELTTKMEQLEAKLEDTNRRLSQLSQQIAETQGELQRLRGASGAPAAPGSPATALPPPTNGNGAKPAAGVPSPSELYDTAYADYTKARYALAIQGFEDYLATYPSTDLSDNAQYWIGESHFAQKKYTEAVADFEKLLKQWPASDKAAAALLKKGYALLELNQKPEAVVQLQYVIHEFPTSEEARLAKAKLKTVGVDTK